MGLAKKEIMRIKPYVPGKPIEEVKRELGISRVIKLASNENMLGPSPKVISVLRKKLASINRYPDGGCFYLKRNIASSLGVKCENIIVGNGSDEIIILALRAFLEKGQEVIIARPTFLIYEIASAISGARIKFAPLKNFRYDVTEIVRLISKRTKFVFIANPDNPTGSYITEKEVRFLMSRLPEGAIVFFDEAYFEFAAEVKDYANTLKYIKRKNVIITRSFSKAYSLAGLRVGYGLAHPSTIDYLNRVREPFNVNSLAQLAASAALSDGNHVKKTLELIREGKAYICDNLEGLGLEYVPSVTNFILIKIGKDAKALYGKLLKQGIIVREMSAWGMADYIRVTVGTSLENRRFVVALKEAVCKGGVKI
jgi:histidinol-phosphate aminotransferase